MISRQLETGSWYLFKFDSLAHSNYYCCFVQRMNRAMLSFSFLAFLCLFSFGEAKMIHEQVHIGLGSKFMIINISLSKSSYLADETEMTVTWSTLSAIPDHPVVLYTEKGHDLTHSELAVGSHFKNFYTYRALLRGLKPGTLYGDYIIDF